MLPEGGKGDASAVDDPGERITAVEHRPRWEKA
jgi:hypothetical protein